MEKLPDALILEVAGIGYELSVTTDDWGSAKLNSQSHYYIYEQIREDTHNLYAFSELASRQMFVLLLGISGVGPKLALQILSSAVPCPSAPGDCLRRSGSAQRHFWRWRQNS